MADDIVLPVTIACMMTLPRYRALRALLRTEDFERHPICLELAHLRAGC